MDRSIFSDGESRGPERLRPSVGCPGALLSTSAQVAMVTRTILFLLLDTVNCGLGAKTQLEKPQDRYPFLRPERISVQSDSKDEVGYSWICAAFLGSQVLS